MSEAKFSILKPGDCRDDEELCVASVSDREAVMAIEPAAFAGYDYLPTTYHEFVAGPGVTGYVYKKRGKVAGFLSTLLVDGGQTITTSAGRVCMELRGEGMYGRFTRRVFERSLDMYPDLRYIAMSTDNLNWDINGNKLRNAYDVLEEMARQRTPRKASQIPGIRRLTWDDMNTVMKDCPRDLFPCGRIMIIRYSYGIMEANTDLIYRQWDKPVFMGSFHEPASEATRMSEAKFSILKPGDCRDDEELCVASVSDREAVMAIEPEGYAGYDYLPTKYEQFISGPPGVTGYLYKKQGKVRCLDAYPDLRYAVMGTHNLNWDINGNKLQKVYKKLLEKLEVKAYRVMEANTDLIYSNGNDRIFLGRGILYQMDAYGNDDTMMRAHIEWHLLRLLDLARTTGKDAFFNPSTPSDVSHIMDAFKDEFGIAKMDIPMSEAKFSILKPGDCRDDEELCVASVSDREAVMAIEPAAFAGYDYLPTTYHKFVAGPGVTGYVYKKRGKVDLQVDTQLLKT
nr:hypothetical protein BaRGS_028553 [Batillaria attramentaria]